MASSGTGCPSLVIPLPVTAPAAVAREATARRTRSTSLLDGSSRTTPEAPSTRAMVPSAIEAAPGQPTTAGIPRDRARIAVWLVGPPCSVTMASTWAGSSRAVSAGARSRATRTNGSSETGMPGIGSL